MRPHCYKYMAQNNFLDSLFRIDFWLEKCKQTQLDHVRGVVVVVQQPKWGETGCKQSKYCQLFVCFGFW